MTAKFEDILVRLTSGPWNWITYIFCSLWGIFGAMQAFATAFLSPETDHWCRIDELMNTTWSKEQKWNFSIPWDEKLNQHSRCFMYDKNYSLLEEQNWEDIGFEWGKNMKIIPCKQWEYDKDLFSSTIVSEWDLVCDQEYMRSFIQSLFMFGVLLGGPIGGIFADRIGRKSLMTKSLVLFLLLSLAASLSTSFPLFLLSRTLMALTGNCIYETSYILAVESCTPRDRSIVGILFSVPFGLGSMILAGLAFYIRDWRSLHITITLPVALLFVTFIILPESPRWLLQRGKIEGAESEIKKAAKWNRVQDWDSVWLTDTLNQIDMSMRSKTDKDGATGLQLGLLKSWCVLKVISLIGLQWVICTLVYYGVSLNATSLGTNPFLYMFLSGLMELPSYILIVPLVVKFGRKKSLILFYGLTTIVVLLPTVSFIDSIFPHWGLTWTMTAKLTVTSAFQVLLLYCSELFPTSIRTQGLGVTSMVGRLGAIFSPFITDGLGSYNRRIPNYIFGVSCAAAVLLLWPLPETNNLPLPETIEDMDIAHRKRQPMKSNEMKDFSLEKHEDTENPLIPATENHLEMES